MFTLGEKSYITHVISQIAIFVINTAAFTYYYDPAILRKKLTPLSIFRDLALRKRDFQKYNCLLLCVL